MCSLARSENPIQRESVVRIVPSRSAGTVRCCTNADHMRSVPLSRMGSGEGRHHRSVGSSLAATLTEGLDASSRSWIWRSAGREGPVLAKIIARSIPFLLSPDDNELLLVVPADSSLSPLAIRRAVAAQLQRELGGGLSSPGRFGTAATLVNQAHAAAHSRPGDDFREYAELGIFGVILGRRSVDELALLTERLRPLEALDEGEPRTENGLLTTLGTYLRYNGHVENTATELGIHRHTLRNSLSKISDLASCDLHTADARAELWLAFKAREPLELSNSAPDGSSRTETHRSRPPGRRLNRVAPPSGVRHAAAFDQTATQPSLGGPRYTRLCISAGPQRSHRLLAPGQRRPHDCARG
jgi:PucR-like helix-turn-helix protein